jgi:dTDP-glucose pyrophosphorylase
MKPTLVILAAGMGSRYGGLKQLDPVGPNGAIIMDYSIYDALQAGFGKVVFVIRRDIEAQFKELIGSRFESRIPCEYVYQELDALPEGFSRPADRQKPWGTGHALLVCEKAVRDPFCVINADDFYGRMAYQKIAAYLGGLAADASSYAMVGFPVINTLSSNGSVARGICETDADGHLISVTERTHIESTAEGIRFLDENQAWQNLGGQEIASLNFWGFTPGFFSHLKSQFGDFLQERISEPKAEFFLPSVVDRLIREGQAQVSVLSSQDRWVGVTYADDKPDVMAYIRGLVDQGLYPENLWG